MIIHISGPSGSGKTTLGKRIQKHFNVTVKDLDDLRDEFINAYYGDKSWSTLDEPAYQKHIDNYIEDIKGHLVLTGLSCTPWNHTHYFDVHATHKYYIAVDDKVILKQKCLRWFHEIINDKIAMDDLVNRNDRFLRGINYGINEACCLEKIKEESTQWNEAHKIMGYTFASADEIFELVTDLLDHK